jgi:hypothetical protein
MTTLSSIEVFVDRICYLEQSSSSSSDDDNDTLLLSTNDFLVEITGKYIDNSIAFQITPQIIPSDWPLINKAIQNNEDFCSSDNEDIYIVNNIVHFTLQAHYSAMMIRIPTALCKEPFLQIEAFISPK